MKLCNDVLRELRTEAGQTKDYMALAMGMSPSHYNRLESGKRTIQMKHIPKIAEAVGKTTDDISLKMNGSSVHNVINNPQYNETVVNVNDIKLLRELLASKDQIIKAKDEVIEVQKSEIEVLLSDIIALKKQLHISS
jgi:transcriptional regulator with XRE-family HTH domain